MQLLIIFAGRSFVVAKNRKRDYFHIIKFRG